MMLTRDQILGAKDIKTEVVKVPEWGGEVIVAPMNGSTRDAWEQSLIGKTRGEVKLENMRARLFASCAVDDKGVRLFSDADVDALGKKSAKALERCVKVIQRINGLSDSDLEESKGN